MYQHWFSKPSDSDHPMRDQMTSKYPGHMYNEPWTLIIGMIGKEAYC